MGTAVSIRVSGNERDEQRATAKLEPAKEAFFKLMKISKRTRGCVMNDVGKCFVTQPFDEGSFDKRYDEVIVPAIEAAGLTPYRVGKDFSVGISVDTIKQEIQNSRVFLADITKDNPNVWFEVGFAFALKKEIVLICEKGVRDKPPFDVNHYHVIEYVKESRSDFTTLEKEITSHIKERIKKADTLEFKETEVQDKSPVSKSGKPVECDSPKRGKRKKRDTQSNTKTPKAISGLHPHEVSTLLAIHNSNSSMYPTGIPARQLRDDVVGMGYTVTDFSDADMLLRKNGFAERELNTDKDKIYYYTYKTTLKGREWLFKNQKRINKIFNTTLKTDKTPEEPS